MDKGKVVLDGEPRNVFNSEKARLIGVGVPKATRLYQILKESGIHLSKIPVTSEEASILLREALKHD
jgi:hypothetical protein